MESEKVAHSSQYPPPYSTEPKNAPPPMQQATVVVTPVTIMAGPRPMGAQSQSAVCHSCNMDIVTEIRFKSNTKTHLIAALLCVVCCWPCAIAAYCVDKFKGIDHYCPRCQTYLGSYKQ